MSKLLFISNISNRISSFVTASISAAHSLNLEFYQAANWQSAIKEQILSDEQEYGIKIKSVPISRNPLSITNLTAYKKLVELIQQEKIEYIHCNTPVGGILGRLAGKKCKVNKVIYQAHGFHFYEGAPLINWLLYYPVEKWLARYTDALITINQEDYDLARRKMKLRKGGKVYYVPGVGIDSEKFGKASIDKGAKRRELGIPEDAVLLLSVGELNQNKNHETVIRAIADMNVYYVIAGTGESQQHLESLIDTHNLQDRVKLLGFRNDVKELYEAADIFVFPSFREGLSVAVMESMASGLPCVISRIRGNVDLIEDGVNGFLCDPRDAAAFAERIRQLLNHPDLAAEFRRNSLEKAKRYDRRIIAEQLREIYCEMTDCMNTAAEPCGEH